MKETSIFHPVFTPFAHVPLMHKVTIAFFWLVTFAIIWSQAESPVPHPMLVIDDLYDFLTRYDFYANLGTSLWLTMKAMFFSIILASILAYSSAIGFFRPVIEILVKVRYMSIMGFLFLFIIMIHSTDNTKLTSLMFGIVPFFSLSMLTVMKRIPPKFYDMWTVLKYNKWEQVWEIVIVGHADYLFETIRANFAICWIMITMVETQVMSDGGLGVLLFKNRRIQDLDKQFAIQIVIFGLGMMFDYLLQQTRYSLFPYVKLAEKK